VRQLLRNRREWQFRNRRRCGVLLYSGIVKGGNSARSLVTGEWQERAMLNLTTPASYRMMETDGR